MTTSQLRGTKIAHAFAQRTVLEDASIVARQGELTVIIGPNGAGKTTLLRILAGILRPQAGEVHIGESPITALSRRALAQRVAFLPQSISVPNEQSVEDFVLLGRYAHRAPWQAFASEDYAHVDRAMEHMQLTNLRLQAVETLSGGELQRTMLARAMAQDANFVMLDEPANNLDPAHVWHTLENLRALANRGRGVVMVLHDLQLAARYADSIALVHKGQVCQGSVSQIMTVEALRNCFGMEARVDLASPAHIDLIRAV